MSGHRRRGQQAGTRSLERATSSQPVRSTARSAPSFLSQTHTPSDGENDLEASSTTAVTNILRLAASGKPFKKSDVMQGCRVKNRLGVEGTFIMAKKKLAEVYGLTLATVDIGKYILVVPKSALFRDELVARTSSVPASFSTLLSVVLTLIFLQEGRVSDEYLKGTMLPRLFPDIKTVPHPYFGNVDKLLQAFEEQIYIARETELRDGENKAFFKWGLRAELEFDKKSVVVPILSLLFSDGVPQSLQEELDACSAANG